VGAYALCTDADDSLLLARVSSSDTTAGRWTLPGGGLEWGERPEHGVLRELRPEVGGSTDTCDWFSCEEARALPLTPLGEFAIPLAWPNEDGAA
jgi:8-oxo-dGTP pyrophosphatase MutT (NUDIX family)